MKSIESRLAKLEKRKAPSERRIYHRSLAPEPWTLQVWRGKILVKEEHDVQPIDGDNTMIVQHVLKHPSPQA